MLTWLYVAASRVHGWLTRRRHETELHDELQAHLAMLADDFARRGLTPEAAARAARVTLGGVTQITEQYHGRRGLPLLDSLWQDVRYALRGFGRTPGFTGVAVLTIAIGIGVNTTVFTLVNAVAFKPLPVSDPGNLVRLERWFGSGARGDVQYAFSPDEYAYSRAHSRRVSTIIAASWPERVVADGEIARGQAVSHDYFTALGVHAAVGRTFLPEDDGEPGAHPVLILGEPFWQRRFHADPQVVGRIVTINGTAFTVIGVAPRAFIGTGNPPQVPDFWAPLSMHAQLGPDVAHLQLLARLARDVPATEARAVLEGLVSQLAGAPDLSREKTITITLRPATYFSGTDDLRFQALVALLMGVVALILLVACANLANMLLARAGARQQELGMRLALGASRARLMRQLLTESLLLAIAGGAAGLLASVWAGQFLWTIVDRVVRVSFLTDVPLVASMTPDLRVFGFAFALSLGAGVLFGLSPALTLSRPNLGAALKDEGAALGGRISRRRLRAWLIAAQVAVSMMLLVCGGLLVRGLAQSQTADPGFDTRRVSMVFLGLGSDPAVAPALHRIVDRLKETPGVENVALVDRFPFGGTWSPPVILHGTRGDRSTRALANYASPTYFETMGIPIRRGRAFTRADGDAGAPVTIVSESAARHFWPAEDPLGKHLQLDMNFRGQLAEFEVVGIARDVRTANLSRVDPAYVYLPTRAGQVYNLLIRSDRDRAGLFAAVRAAIESVDRTLAPTVSMTSVKDGPMLRIQMVMPQLLAALIGVLACLALILATVGISGVTAYLVSQRTREIGIRMALGASTGHVLRLIVRQGMGPAMAGGLVGLCAAAGVSALLRTFLTTPSSPDLLFGVGAFDPLTFVGLPLSLAAIAAIASYVPARRALRVDPLVALRCD